ncbi:transcriptional regulator, partial [Acinetobacter baumannii]
TVRASSRETSGEANEKRASQGRAAELDRLIHERVRLAILSALAASGPLTFSELKEIVGTTDGNLSVHARKLEDAKYIVCTKGF